MRNEAKHTEGPWTASQTYPHGDWCIHSAGIPWQLAYVGASTQIDWPLAANAHLIAAAPDLLAALLPFVKEALRLGLSSLRPGDERLKVIATAGDIRTALAAIAKAEGRQP